MDNGAPARDTAGWRAFLTVAVLAAAVLIALQFPPAKDVPALGFASAPAAAASRIVVTAVEPDGAAARAGLRPGDRIDLAAMSVGDRIRLLYQRHAGDAIEVAVERGAARLPLTIRPLRRDRVPFDWWLGIAGAAALAIFAAIIGWRRPDSGAARLLALVLLASVLSTALAATNFGRGGPAVELAGWSLAALIAPLGPLFFTLYAARFGVPTAGRRTVAMAQYVLAAISAIAGLLPVVSTLTLAVAPALASVVVAIDPTLDVQYLVALLAGMLAVGASAGDDRRRILWATIASAPYIVAAAFSGYPFFPEAIVNVALPLWAIGLAYAALRGRLLDVAFAVNRAAVFATLSAIVLVLFVAFEWVIAEWFAPAGHDAGIALSLGFALVVGISMRFVHHRVDHLIDRLLFRKRNAELEALRAFAREAPFITDRDVLIARAIAVVKARTGASEAAVVENAGDRANDPAMVAMRARRAPVELAGTGSAIPGEIAFPLFTGATLFGALACGAKSGGESYAPDEIAALQSVADGVAEAMLVLANDRTGALERIAASQERILEELRAIRTALGHR